MATNQEGVHAAIRASTGTARDYIADWHALFDAASIASGTFNERLLAWINAQLSTSYVSLPTAMQAYAVDAGFARWSDINTLSLGAGAVSLAETLAGSETDALAIVYTDDHFKATTGFNGSVYCLDSGTPANDYDSSPTTETASYFTYTSPSPKMILHDDGVLKYAAHNLVTYSEDLTNAAYTKNRVTITANATTTSTGDSTADKIVEDGTASLSHGVAWQTTAVAGASYYLSVELKAAERTIAIVEGNGAAFGTSVYFFVDLSNGTITGTTGGTPQPTNKTIEDLGNGWYRVSAVYTAVSASAAGIGVYLSPADGTVSYNGDNSSGLYASRFQITRYPADTTYLRTTSAARYADPIEFNSAGTALGALVEPQRTNTSQYSKDISNAWWTKAGASAASATTAPDGTSTAYKLIEDTSTGEHRVGRASSVAASNSTVYTMSLYIKTAERDRIRLYIFGFSNYTAIIDCAGESVVSASGGTSPTVRFLDAPTGWVRISITDTTTSTELQFDGISLVSTGTTFSYTGDGSSGLYPWGMQVELGSAATSMIETYSASVTRAADNISKASSAFPTDTANMTLYARWTPRGYDSSGGYHVFNYNDGTQADWVTIYTAGASHDIYPYIVSGSSVQMDADSGSDAAIGTSSRAALAYSSNDGTIVVDGTAGTNDTSLTVPTGSMTQIILGSGGTVVANRFMHGHIQEILILPRRVSDADMQTLTSTGALP